jgi:uncharacterized repeat protein (TIGR01451 family)
MKKLTLLTTFFLCLAQVAFAAGKVTLKIDMFQQKTVVEADGKSHIQLVPLNKVVPGTVVTYVIHYTNDGKQAAEKVVIHDPVPEHMTYVEGSAEGKGTVISYSVDSGKHWARKIDQLSVKDVDGKKRIATAADVTTLRWQVEGKVAAGTKGQVQFAAQLK